MKADQVLIIKMIILLKEKQQKANIAKKKKMKEMKLKTKAV